MAQLLVQGLSADTSDIDLAKLFLRYGAVDSVRIMRDWFTGRPLGFGFVDMGTAADAERARFALNGYVLDGRLLHVSRSERRTNDLPRVTALDPDTTNSSSLRS